MLRRIAVLALLLGILPAAVQALPRGSGTDAPAAVHSARDWRCFSSSSVPAKKSA